MAEPFERFEDPNADHRGDHARAMRELDALAKSLAQPPAQAADAPPAVPPSPLRRRRERLGTPGSIRELRKLYGRKSLIDAGVEADRAGDIDLDAKVDGHDLLSVVEGLAAGLKEQIAGERDGLAAEAGRMIEKHLGKRLDEMDARWKKELAQAAESFRRQLDAQAEEAQHLVAEVRQEHARELARLRAEFDALAERQEAGVRQVVELLARQPVPSVVLPAEAIAVRVEQPAVEVRLPRRKTIKKVLYDPTTGRPAGIEEVESDTRTEGE
jgi:hypothetical protein